MEFHDTAGNIIKVPDGQKFGFRPAVYAFIIMDNKLLAVKPEWDTKYALPGGAMEPGEDFHDALKRELLEECGYSISIRSELPAYIDTKLFVRRTDSGCLQRISLYFEASIQEELEEPDVDEIEEVVWLDPASISPADFTYFQQDMLGHMLAQNPLNRSHMKIGIVGSMQFTEKMLAVKDALAKLGHDPFVTSFAPTFVSKTSMEIESLKLHQKNNKDAIREFWNLMQGADAILVLNLDKDGIKNYIGGNTLMEIGFAHVLGQKIFLYNPVPEITYYKTEIEAVKPVIINGDLGLIR